MVKTGSKSIIRKRKRRSDFGKKRKAKNFTDKMVISTKENFIASVSSTSSSITSNSNASKSPTPMLYSIITPQNPLQFQLFNVMQNQEAPIPILLLNQQPTQINPPNPNNAKALLKLRQYVLLDNKQQENTNNKSENEKLLALPEPISQHIERKPIIMNTKSHNKECWPQFSSTINENLSIKEASSSPDIIWESMGDTKKKHFETKSTRLVNNNPIENSSDFPPYFPFSIFLTRIAQHVEQELQSQQPTILEIAERTQPEISNKVLEFTGTPSMVLMKLLFQEKLLRNRAEARLKSIRNMT